jgi:hypothetical protein
MESHYNWLNSQHTFPLEKKNITNFTKNNKPNKINYVAYIVWYVHYN